VVLAVFWPGLVLADDAWENIAPGADHLHRVTGDPFDIHAVVIDLTHPEIWIRTTAEAERGQPTSAWSSGVGATVAVNGDIFDYNGYRPNGLTISNGAAWSNTADPDWWAFMACNVTKECWFSGWGTAAPVTPRMWNTIGGSQDLLVINGAPVVYMDPFYTTDRQPRSAVGISQDQSKMILVTVDGRQGSSIGATFNDMGALMFDLGAHDAMMLDGGGSTTMVINGQVRNSPSDGVERAVANHIGIMIGGPPAAECAGHENSKSCTDATHLATCEGGRFLGAGDCGYFGLTCEAKDDFAYCVDPRCMAGGQGHFCLDATRLAGCEDGVYGDGDCAAFGVSCVSGFGDAWCAKDFWKAELVQSSFSGPVQVPLGGQVPVWFELKNTGLSPWTKGTTLLAPIPRDMPSPYAGSGWLSPTRAATVTADVAPGQTGRFEFTIAGAVAGEAMIGLGLVQEGVTWFGDKPGGGGPADSELSIPLSVCDGDCTPATSGGGDAGGRPTADAGVGPGMASSDGGHPGTAPRGGSSNAAPQPDGSPRSDLQGGCSVAGPTAPQPSTGGLVILAMVLGAALRGWGRRRRQRSAP
jgi:hypothetical protein